MAGSFEYIDHTADIAVKISADSLSELFACGARALIDSSVSEMNFRSLESKRINLNEYSPEELLVSFLSEINYLFTVKKWIIKDIVKIAIEEYENIWQLKTLCEGSADADYKPKDEIKAVTYHQMEIKYTKGIYETIIVFDI